MTYFPRRYFPARYFPGGYFGSGLETIPHLFFAATWSDNIWLTAEWVTDMAMRAELETDIELVGLLTSDALDGRWSDLWDFKAQHAADVALRGGYEMAVKNAKVEMFAGNRRNLNITVSDDAGDPLNLTGYSATFKLMKMKQGTVEPTPVLTLTSNPAAGITFPTPANGVVRAVIATGATSAFFGQYHWELELTDSAADTNVVATGTIDILKNH